MIFGITGKIRQRVVIAADADYSVGAELFRVFDQRLNDIFERIRARAQVRLHSEPRIGIN
jgi:hypothetical protein